MVELLLKRYLWLVDTLKRGGEMTFEEISDKWLRLVPTFDFVQELLLHRDQLEVISPLSLRNEMCGLISKMKDRYAESQ